MSAKIALKRLLFVGGVALVALAGCGSKEEVPIDERPRDSNAAPLEDDTPKEGAPKADGQSAP